MSTKAQLEQEIVKMTEERDLFLRQIKNLKKRKNAQPAVVDPTWKGLQEVLKEELETAKRRLITKDDAIQLKDELIALHKKRVQQFLELSWVERAFLSKEDVKKLL